MRPKRGKTGQKRIDAALDALARMGFAREKIRKTVNHLLKEVYSGDEAWVFLEEDSYSVVIEALLEEQETKASERPHLVEGEDAKEMKAPDFAEACSGIAEDGEQGNRLQSPSSAVSASIVQFPSALDIAEASSGIAEDGEQGNKLRSPSSAVSAIDATVQGENGENCRPLANGYLVRRRPPCYGWISEDEDETSDALPPARKKQAYGAKFT